VSTREEPWPQGTPSWTDLTTSDQAAASEFYRALFGWDVEVGGAEYGGYGMCTVHGRPVCGMGQAVPGTEAPPAWTTYLAVEDADKAADAIAANGGTIVMPPMQVGDQGRMAIAQDPTGAYFGIWQAGEHYGAQIVNEPGAVVWNECMTRDPQRAREFYAAVFGYTYRPVEGADDYVMIDGDGPGGTVGGIGGMDPGMAAETPPHWMAYFLVSSADEAAATARRQGGTVLAGPTDTPFGRMAVIRDPQGATFSIMEDTSGPPS
jgi:hypothetical protein